MQHFVKIFYCQKEQEVVNYKKGLSCLILQKLSIISDAKNKEENLEIFYETEDY